LSYASLFTPLTVLSVAVIVESIGPFSSEGFLYGFDATDAATPSDEVCCITLVLAVIVASPGLSEYL